MSEDINHDEQDSLDTSPYIGHAIDPETSRTYAQKFLDAQTIKYVSSVDEDDNVKALIDELEADYDIVWRDLGRLDNNYGLIESSQGSKMGALVEIITNAFDAVMVRRYRERHGESYDPSHAITTYDEAADLLFNQEEREYGPDGKGSDETWVELYADGGGRRGNDHGANFVVLDHGEGKPTEDFEDTFLDVLEPGQSKREWPFLQGQFGMGGSAVLSYCGKGYKFIASASMERPQVWTWSVVRRNREKNTYEYLTFDGRPPTFEGEFAGREVGSVVKMYDYEDSFAQLPGQGAYTLGRTLYDIPMAMRLDDRRDYSSAVQHRRWYGHKYTLENTAKNNGFVEEQFTVTHDFGGAETDDQYVDLGEIDVDIFVFKSNREIERQTIEEEFELDPDTPKSELDDTQKKRLQNRVNRKRSYRGNVSEHRDRAISLVVNGQVHGDFGRQTLTGNTVGLDNVGKDILAYIDFSNLNGATLTDTFQSNRSYINDDKPLGQRVRDEVFDLFKGNETLEQYEEERKRSRRKREHDERDIETVESILEDNPHLSQFFGSFGSIFPSLTDAEDDDGVPVGVEEEEEDDGSPPTPGPDEQEDWVDLKYIPTTLDLLEKVKQSGEPVEWGGDTEDDQFVKEVPVESSGWVKFKLDAENDYFTRQREHGELNVLPDEMVVDTELVNGILGVRVEPFKNASPGDTYTVTVEVTRPDSDALTDEFKVECVEKQDRKDSKPDPEEEPENESELLKAIGKPDIELVSRDEWGEEFNEEVIVYLEGHDPRDFTYFVNEDAAPLVSFRERKNLNEDGETIINQEWAAIVFYMTLGSYMKWAVAVDQKLRENGMEPFLDDDLLPDSQEERERDPLMPNEDDVESVINNLGARAVEQIDPRRMAAASVAGSVQTLLDWRYTNEDLDGLVES